MEVLKSKIPTIIKTDFDFVKHEKNVVTLPVVKTGHKWDFAHVKNLCGQGRLYVKLNVSKDELLNRGNSDDKLSKPTFSRTERALVIEENAASVESDQNSVPQQTSQCGRYMYWRHQICSTASSGFISRPGPSHAQPLLHSNNASPGSSSSWQFLLEVSQIESLRGNISSPFWKWCQECPYQLWLCWQSSRCSQFKWIKWSSTRILASYCSRRQSHKCIRHSDRIKKTNAISSTKTEHWQRTFVLRCNLLLQRSRHNNIHTFFACDIQDIQLAKDNAQQFSVEFFLRVF